VNYESHAAALDRNEVGALLVAAGLGPAAEHALVSLLALNGLRVSEATGADIEHLGLERGHRTLVITRKGGKVVTIPLAPRTARAIDLAIGERASGPLFLAADGRRLDRHGAARVVRRVTRRAGVSKQVSPHTLRHAFITAALDAGVSLRDVQEAALPRRPAHHHALRPRPHQPRPACHLHRRHLHRRSSSITGKLVWPPPTARTTTALKIANVITSRNDRSGTADLALMSPGRWVAWDAPERADMACCVFGRLSAS
jgi:integrase